MQELSTKKNFLWQEGLGYDKDRKYNDNLLNLYNNNAFQTYLSIFILTKTYTICQVNFRQILATP